MHILATIIPLFITLSLAGMVLVVGLDAERDDLFSLFQHPTRLLKAFLAVNVIVPIAAVMLIFLFPLTPIAKAGVLLMAVSPVPPLLPGKAIKTSGQKIYSVGLCVGLSALAIVVVPLSLDIMSWIFGVDVSLSVGAVARRIALSVALPLALGLLIRRLAPAFAQGIRPIVSAAANAMLIIALIPLLIRIWPGMMALIGNGTVLAMALTALIALCGGHLLGGPRFEDRAALAITAATRHPGIAIMIASANAADNRVTAAILMFVLVGLLVALPYQLWVKRRMRLPGVGHNGTLIHSR